tara:strand:+ start:1545 stop:1799 length:255 start_codon:yes stop_codon:yes gene_type:complete
MESIAKIKRGRGRPRLNISDSERVSRSKAQQKKYSSDKSTLILNAALRKRFEVAKQEQERKLGFAITNQQFITVLLTGWENDQS